MAIIGRAGIYGRRGRGLIRRSTLAADGYKCWEGHLGGETVEGSCEREESWESENRMPIE